MGGALGGGMARATAGWGRTTGLSGTSEPARAGAIGRGIGTGMGGAARVTVTPRPTRPTSGTCRTERCRGGVKVRAFFFLLLGMVFDVAKSRLRGSVLSCDQFRAFLFDSGGSVRFGWGGGGAGRLAVGGLPAGF